MPYNNNKIQYLKKNKHLERCDSSPFGDIFIKTMTEREKSLSTDQWGPYYLVPITALLT